MKRYIITEEHLKDFEDGDLTLKQLKEIRSNPYNPQAEREKVLQELWDWASPEVNELDGDGRLHKGVCVHASGRLLQKIDKMREELREGKDGE